MQKLSRLEEWRRGQKRGEKIEEEKDPVFLAYCSFVEDRRKELSRKTENLRTRIAFESFLLNEARAESRKHSVNGESRSSAASRKHAARIQELRDQLSSMEEKDPDAFYVQKEALLSADMDNEHAGRLVDVPYLKTAKEQIRTSLEAGIPVYLVGHLGSGKTQLAVECAEDFMRERVLNRKLQEEMDSFQSSHPGASEEEEFSHFTEIYPQARADAESADCHPYFIAGSHNLTAEDMFYEKTLKLAHASDGKSNEDQLEGLINGFVSFLHENEGFMKDMTKEQQLELMLAGWKTFSNLYIAQNSGYGTIVEKIEKEVLKALKEGRPIVIDEINTIAMANLIGLNDILQHHAGQSAYITGVGTVKIEEGFCLIGTGNLSTGTVSYEGTNVLNPAFQSRFTTIVYNYVPQSMEGEIGAQEHPEKNELFRLLVEHLCDEEGNLYLPEPSKSLPQLWHLAELARTSQNIFEGRSTTVNPGGDTPVLNEAVLSIRGLIHVLDHWNFGEEEDLSMALWNGFLSSVTNSDDRNLLLGLSVRYGFFMEQDGWHVEARGRGDAALTLDDIRTSAYRHVIAPLSKLSKEDVISLLFGKGPARRDLPDNLKGQVFMDRGFAGDAAGAASMDASIRSLEHGSDILDTLSSGEQK